MTKILVVDDAAFIRSWCSSLLRQRGYEVAEAASHSEALTAYRRDRPDGVLLDMTAPQSGGAATLMEIMKIDPAARVAMVTAMGQDSVVLSALQAGARDSLMKPFDGAQVLDAVAKLVG